MKIICTGISCSGRKELLKDFEALCVQRQLNIGFFNVGDYMHRVAAESRVHFTEKVLDSDPAVLSLARRTAFYEIAQDAAAYQHAIIGLHACFRWRGSLLEGFSFKDIDIIPPDMFINVVDNIADIYGRMEKSSQWSGIRKAALNVWLDEEEFLTRQLAHLTEKPHYTVARQHNLVNFYELLFSAKPKFYLSYPITLLRDTPKEIQRIRKLGDTLAQSYICFDPLAIKDMALVTFSKAEADDDMLNVPETMSELDDDVIEQIKTRTISRDYQFVHQSDFVVVIYPTDKLSPGVLSEMNYATRHNKPVYAVYNETRSIFFENLCDKIFDTFEELDEFLKITYNTNNT
ncbi:MAG: AAA family ATPase [Candidatus Poribacteria bacterium]|nr:AAA family ATPase [Candidatus Poribacteria bacterium]